MKNLTPIKVVRLSESDLQVLMIVLVTAAEAHLSDGSESGLLFAELIKGLIQRIEKQRRRR